jgi:hypothetical protein
MMNAKRSGLLALSFVVFGSACGPIEDDQHEMGLAATEGAAAVDESIPCCGAWNWSNVTGGGSDIGIDSSYQGVWVIGTLPYSGGMHVYRYNPNHSKDNPWDASNIGGRRIGVGADGRPWVVKDGGEIWYLQTVKAFGSTDSATGTWIHQPGCATDIGAGPSFSTTWYVGCQANSAGNYAIYQVGFSGSITSDGAAVRIAVSDQGVPWVVSAAGYVYQRTSTSALSGTWQTRSSGGMASDISVTSDTDVVIITKTPNDKHGSEIKYRDGSAWTTVYGLGTSVATRGGIRYGGSAWLVNKQDNVYRGQWVW